MLLRHFLRRHPPRSPANVVPRGHWRPAAHALAGLSPVRGRGTHGWPHRPWVVGWIPPQQPGGMTIYPQGMTVICKGEAFMASKIARIIGREILDSRGNPTVEVDVYLSDG